MHPPKKDGVAPQGHPDIGNAAFTPLHVAEYESLMTRNSYLMTLQFALWPILFVILGFTFQVWSLNKISERWVVLGCETALLIVAINWADVLWELYNNVSYIEHVLRPRLGTEATAAGVWGYERFLAEERGSKPTPTELLFPILGVVLVGGTLVYLWPVKAWEYIAVIIVIGLEVGLWARCLGATRLRRHFFDGT